MTDPKDEPVADTGEKLADKPVLPKRLNNTTLITAAATGIGSAALVAALMYANKSRRKKPTE